MRNDLPSMNAGKAMAQASHASNYFVAVWPAAAEEWRGAGGHFSTVLVLSASLQQILEAKAKAREKALACDTIIDETYPYQTTSEIAALIPTTIDTAPRFINGDRATLYRKEPTCAFICGTKEECKDILGHLSLHP